MAFCTRCGTGLPDQARFCPACGAAVADTAVPAPEASVRRSDPAPLAPLRPDRGGGGGLILGAMIVVALAVIGFFLWSQRDGMRPIAGNASDPAVAAADGDTNPPAARDAARTTVAALDAAFIADPAAARRHHAGPVTVSGTVVSLTGGTSPSLSLEGRTRFNYVVANVADAAPFAGVAGGDRVTLHCRQVTALAGTTILQGCTPA